MTKDEWVGAVADGWEAAADSVGTKQHQQAIKNLENLYSTKFKTTFLDRLKQFLGLEMLSTASLYEIRLTMARYHATLRDWNSFHKS